MTDKDIKINWCDIYGQIPDLILEMMACLRCSNADGVREFCVLRDEDHSPSPGNRFALYESEHADLLANLDLLAQRGCIAPVASEAEPVYGMTNEFRDHLLDGWPEQRWPEWWLARR